MCNYQINYKTTKRTRNNNSNNSWNKYWVKQYLNQLLQFIRLNTLTLTPQFATNKLNIIVDKYCILKDNNQHCIIVTYLLWKHCCKMQNENKNKNKNISSSVGVFYFMKHGILQKRQTH